MLRLRVRELADSRGISFEALRPISGLTEEELRLYWEGEVARPSLAALDAIAVGLDVAVGDLFARAAAEAPTRPGLARLAAYGVTREEIEKLERYLAAAEDADLVRFNAYRLAAEIGVPRRRMLTILAAAVESGIVDLNWELFCLACLDQRAAFSRLQEARSLQTCKNCHATYDAPLDLEIVVTFDVNPTVRRVAGATRRRREEEGVPKVTAHDVMTVQRFRDLFVAEPLPRQESFQVQRTALMFTDLGGSTALYARRGDPQAFGLVRQHFDLLARIVVEEGGAVVKTLGDAVMAAFPLSELAFTAGCRAQRSMAAFNIERGLQGADALALKVALHAGPCLVVTLNDRLDYFGTTVNVAARLQKLARARELLFTDDLHGDVAALVDAQPVERLAESPSLRGLEDRPVGVYRMSFA